MDIDYHYPSEISKMELNKYYKLAIFAPANSVDQVIKAATDLGAGVIGKYSHNAFVTSGTGNWLPEQGAKPAIGKIGKLSQEPESKIEIVCPRPLLKEVLVAIKSVHPYEWPEIDIYEIDLVDWK